jgi:arylsulfatase A-like enzyme
VSRRTTIPLRGRRVPPRPYVPGVSSASLFALALLLTAPGVLVGCGGCGNKERAGQAAGPFRFVDHLAEARIEGKLPEGGGDERLVYSDPLEVSAGHPPEGFTPFGGFEPAPDAGPGERAEWSDARDQVAAAIAPGPDEREAGSRGLLFRRPSSGEFTGLYSPLIPVHPGAMYRAEVWLRTESLAVPSPEAGAGLLVYGLTLGREARAVPDERIDDQDFFSNRAVTLETLEPPTSYTGTTGWTRVSVTVRTNQSVDHILIELAMHGPQPRGPRSGSARFDDLRLFEMVPPVSAIPALADHFIGGRHDLKKKVRLGEPGAAEGEVARSAILASAPGEIAFEVRIPQPARLAFSYAVPQRVWNEGGGVTFAVEVAAGDVTRRVFEATLRPGAEPADRAWRSAHADLSEFGGKSATVRFVTAREGSAGASAGLWGEPILYAPEKTPRGILLVSIDTLRPDHLGCYGSPRRVSPEIDRLAASGALFETCVSAASWTLPAHVSMLTGVSPSVHRVTEDARRLGVSRVTLPEILRHEGYATGAFVTHYYLTSDYGLDRGFESFAYRQDAPAAEVSARAAAWIAENGDRPFFLFLHFFDPHWDYHPGAPYTGVIVGADAPPYEGPVDGTLESMQPWIDPRTPVAPADLARAIDLYDAEIAGVDDALGSLFAALDASGLAARTLVVLTSDHGEEFRDHGSFGHAHTLYEELLRVPLIVRAPREGAADAGGPGAGARGDRARASGAGPGAIRGDVAATIDLAPTILGWAGITEEMVSAATGGGAGKGAPAPADTTPAIWMPEGRDLLGDSRSGSSRKKGGAGASFSATVADRMLVSETERFGTWRLAVRRGRLKYITPGRYVWWREFVKGPELYDLEADPGERANREMGIGDQMEGAGLVDAATWIALTRHKGILLVFRGGGSGIHSVRGKISGAHLGAATGVEVEMSDLVEEWQDGVEIALDLSARDRDVLLLRTNHPGTARVELSWDGGSPAAGLVVAGPERRSASLPFEITPGAHLDPPDPGRILAWDGPGVWILASEEEAGTTFALDEEEIARLRAIGYTE